MAIIQNHFYNINFPKEDIIKILMKIEDYKGQIFPQTAKQIGEYMQGVEPLEKINPYNTAIEQINSLMDLLGIKKENEVYSKKQINIQDIMNYIEDINKKVTDIKTVIDNINDEKNENKQAVKLLKRLKKEDISLDELHELKYITLRFGKIPVLQFEKIKYFENEHFIFKELSKDDDYIWIVYCALDHEMGEIDNIFLSMDFKEVTIPDFAHGKIDDAIEELHNEQKAMEQYIKDLESRIERIRNKNKQKIISYFQQLSYLKELYDNCNYAVNLKDKAAIYIFTPFNKKEITDIFHNDYSSIVELPVNIYQEKGIKEPILLKNNNFVKPFETFTKFKSGDIFDPTTLIAIVMMLSSLLIGDLAIGVMLILLSVILKGKNAALLQREGLVILIGGLLTGTIFYQGPIYNGLLNLSCSIVMRFVLFIGINVLFYFIMMMIKNISRKKAVIKGGV